MLSTDPPPIPAGHKAARWEAHARDHLMMWVHTGRAHVRLADGERHRVDEGTGIWLPPGPDHEMWTEAGSVAVPVSVPAAAVPDAPDRVVRFAVEDRWRDWLVARYAQGMRRHDGPRTSDLLAVLTAAGPELPRTGAPADDPPAVPRAGAAAAVARELRRQPALDHTLEEWAAATACSPSTLRRQFHHGTGLSFARWRALWRLSVARDHLTAGGTVADAAAHSSDPPRATGPVRSQGVAGWNELTWIYRGEGRSRVGDASFATRRGDAVWAPAGTEYESLLPAGSIAVPLGDVCADCVHVPEPVKARFPPSWDTYLLHCSVSGNTLLHPTGYHVRHIVGVFDAQLAVERARTVPMPTDVRARAVADGFLRRVGAGDAAHDVPPEVHAAFRRETGMTFASWRHAARMRIARDLLVGGTAPSAVAGQVGYGRVANFSRAFSRFHGTAPREWQAHELEAPAGRGAGGYAAGAPLRAAANSSA
ncbi:AraC family transcriptional regulator [Pseudonocardia abyssalis]|uniref:AraC family transcriptional regulator n=1 Tax=Pseudonocardia abyssalis TaxID=2792008 RepID=UPI001C4A5D67|nr:AraC family transcriptional regulator [Pseudonocardia abyssalis]MBW0114774.1 AraC family transcriptional regulator [Pseudonocardia abyssalis]